MLSRVFDLFTQVDHSLDRSNGGLGLGLTVVRSLVELHGGSVQASSDGAGPGQRIRGSTAGLESRGRAGSRHDRSRSSAVAKPQCTTATATLQRKVLVVDDNVISAQSLEHAADPGRP